MSDGHHMSMVARFGGLIGVFGPTDDGNHLLTTGRVTVFNAEPLSQANSLCSYINQTVILYQCIYVAYLKLVEQHREQ